MTMATAEALAVLAKYDDRLTGPWDHKRHYVTAVVVHGRERARLARELARLDEAADTLGLPAAGEAP